MKKIKIGNDIHILWRIYEVSGVNETPYILEGKNLKLYLKSAFSKVEVKDFDVYDNAIKFALFGKDQYHSGIYSMSLVVNDGHKDMYTAEENNAFEIVNSSCMTGGDNGGNIEVVTIELKGTTLISGAMIAIDDHLSTTSKNTVQNKVVTAALNEKVNKSEIPTKTSQLTNDSGFITAEEAPAPDWNASTYKEGHIKNRTHHMQDYMCHYFNGSPIKISKPSDTGYVLLTYDTDLADKFVRIEIKSNESKTEEFLDAMGMPLIFTWDAGNSTINVQSFGGAIETYGMRAYYSSSTKGYDDYFIALDEGFIPEEVARKRELKTINGQSILGDGDIEIKGGSSTFVTDFTVNDLYELVYRGAHPVQANIVALQRALENKERIVVPYGTEEFMGYSLLQGYYEDLVYFTVADENGSTYVVEVGQYAGEIDRDNITHVSPKENKNNIADLQNNIAARNVGAVDVEGGAEAPDAPSGGPYDDTEIKERLEEQDQLIEDLQNMKIDREADDYYPKLAVGLADNLAGVDVVDSEINFRRSGGGAITDGVARIESIKGNSVVWNQLAMKATKSTTMNGVTFTVNEDGSVVANGTASATAYIVINNNYYTDASHKFAVFGSPEGGSTTTYYFGDGNALNDIDGNGTIRNGRGSNSTFACRVQSGNTATNVVYRPRIIDLTQMFGAGNEPTTIEEFYARIPMGVDLNAYNEGEVIHMDVQSIESVGVNQWDEEWEIGAISGTNGENIDVSTRMRSKNYIPLIPFKAYSANIAFGNGAFFYDDKKGFIIRQYGISSIPQNARYMRFVRPDAKGTTYNHDICINISDPSINGKYYPYIKRVEDLSIIRKYFPNGMKSAGSAHDEIRYNKESGKWEKVVRIGDVDMGSLNWKNLDTSNGMFYLNTQEIAALNMAKSANTEAPTNLMSLLYRSGPTFSIDNLDKVLRGPFTTAYSGYLTLKDKAYTDAAALKASLQGVILYYELAEPIVTELDAEDQFKDLDYQVWNCGTEKAIAEGKSAPLAADITYGFNAIGKIKELESLVAALRAKVGI